MFRSRDLAAALVCLALGAGAAFGGEFGLGRVATPEEIAGWDIDVRPDGQGLPEGSSTVEAGEEVYAEKCAYCHGDFGEAVGRYPALAGGQDTLSDERPEKTIGSYWPHASTLYDYIYRAMPFGDAQSLTPNEVYGVIAYLLYMNDLIEDDAVVSHENLIAIELPNARGFVPDPRPEEFATGAPCMRDCRAGAPPVITSRAKPLDVTPEGDVVE